VDELCSESDRDLFNFPFLYFANGDPWHEANDYLLSLMHDKSPENRRTDDIRRRASRLMNYLLFCEGKNLDWLDFSGARPSHRPTYMYFYHLTNSRGRSKAVINQYTATVYRFYKYISKHWYEIDMQRVDMTKQVKLIVQGYKGAKIIDVEKRSQTPVSPSF